MKYPSKNIFLRQNLKWRESLAKFLAVALVVGMPFNSFGQAVNGPILCAALFKQANQKAPTSKSSRSFRSVLDFVEESLSEHERWDIEHIKSEMKKELEPGLDLSLTMQEFRRRLLPLLIKNPERRESIIRMFEAELRLQSEVVLSNIQKGNTKYDFIIKGAGVHGAIIAAELLRINPKWRILIVEAQDTVGSNFRLLGDMIRLNSSGKPTRIDERALPGEGDINRLPNLPIQVSDLDSARFPAAKALGDSLVSGYYALSKMNGVDILLTTRGESIESSGDFSTMVLTKDSIKVGQVTGFRTLAAPGLGKTLIPETVKNFIAQNPDVTRSVNGELPLISTYEDAVRLMANSNVPLRLVADKKIGLAGGGDSGNTFTEIIARLTVSSGMGGIQVGIASILYWFGQKAKTCEEFIDAARSRYAEIGHVLPSSKNPAKKSLGLGIPEKVVSVKRAADPREIVAVLEDGRNISVNHLVFASGSKPKPPEVDGVRFTYVEERTGAFGLTKVGIYDSRFREFIVGPATGDLTNKEQKYNVVENFVSIFNNAPRAIATARKAARDYRNQFMQAPIEQTVQLKTVGRLEQGSELKTFLVENLGPIRTTGTASSLNYLENVFSMARQAFTFEISNREKVKIKFQYLNGAEKLVITSETHDVRELISSLSITKDFFNTIAMMLKGANGSADLEIEIGATSAKVKLVPQKSDRAKAFASLITATNVSNGRGLPLEVPLARSFNLNSQSRGTTLIGSIAMGKDEFAKLNGQGEKPTVVTFTDENLVLGDLFDGGSGSTARFAGDFAELNRIVLDAGNGQVGLAKQAPADIIRQPLDSDLSTRTIVQGNLEKNSGVDAKGAASAAEVKTSFDVPEGSVRTYSIAGVKPFRIENSKAGSSGSSLRYRLAFFGRNDLKEIEYYFESAIKSVGPANDTLPQYALVTEVSGKTSLVATYKNSFGGFDGRRFQISLLDQSYIQAFLNAPSQNAKSLIQDFVTSTQSRLLSGEVSFDLVSDGKEIPAFSLREKTDSQLSLSQFALRTTEEALGTIRKSGVISFADARALLTVVSFAAKLTGKIDYTDVTKVFMALIASGKIEDSKLAGNFSMLINDFVPFDLPSSTKETEYTFQIRKMLIDRFENRNANAAAKQVVDAKDVREVVLLDITAVKSVQEGKDFQETIAGTKFLVRKNRSSESSFGLTFGFVGADGRITQAFDVPTGFDAITTTSFPGVVNLKRGSEIVGVIVAPISNESRGFGITLESANFDIGSSGIAENVRFFQSTLQSVFSNVSLESARLVDKISEVDKRNRTQFETSIAQSKRMLTGEELVYLLKTLSLSDLLTGRGSLKDRFGVLRVVLQKNRISLAELSQVTERIINDCFAPEKKNLRIASNAKALRELIDRRLEVALLIAAAKRRFVEARGDSLFGKEKNSNVARVLEIEEKQYSSDPENGRMSVGASTYDGTRYKVHSFFNGSRKFYSTLELRYSERDQIDSRITRELKYQFKRPILAVDTFPANRRWVIITFDDGSKALVSNRDKTAEVFYLISPEETSNFKYGSYAEAEQQLQSELLKSLEDGTDIEDTFAKLSEQAIRRTIATPGSVPARDFLLLRRWVVRQTKLNPGSNSLLSKVESNQLEKEAIERAIELGLFQREELRSSSVQSLIERGIIDLEWAGLINILVAPPRADSKSRTNPAADGLQASLLSSLKIVGENLFDGNRATDFPTVAGGEITYRSEDKRNRYTLRRGDNSFEFSIAPDTPSLGSASERGSRETYKLPIVFDSSNAKLISSISRFSLDKDFVVTQLIGGRTVLSDLNGKDYQIFDFRPNGAASRIENKEIKEFEYFAIASIFNAGPNIQFGENSKTVRDAARLLIEKFFQADTATLSASDFLELLKWVDCERFFRFGEVRRAQRIEFIKQALAQKIVERQEMVARLPELSWLLNLPEVRTLNEVLNTSTDPK